MHLFGTSELTGVATLYVLLYVFSDVGPIVVQGGLLYYSPNPTMCIVFMHFPQYGSASLLVEDNHLRRVAFLLAIHVDSLKIELFCLELEPLQQAWVVHFRVLGGD